VKNISSASAKERQISVHRFTDAEAKMTSRRPRGSRSCTRGGENTFCGGGCFWADAGDAFSHDRSRGQGIMRWWLL